MLDLAKHIVNQKAADFEPERFEDQYEEALTNVRSDSQKTRPWVLSASDQTADIAKANIPAAFGEEPNYLIKI
jgi:non-homologous end joining protein Ku